MREIKFRAKKEHENSWVIGSYVNEVNKDFIVSIDSSSHLIRKNTLGQYTGLKDSEGIEIYEGDILIDKFGQEKCVVQWRGYSFVCVFSDQQIVVGLTSQAFSDKMVIVGNIYDGEK